MVQLTWREVSAPNFSGVGQSQQLAATLIQNSMKGLGDALTNFQNSRNDAADSAYLAQLNKYSNINDLNQALASGEINADGVSIDAQRLGLAQRQNLENVAARGLQNTGLDIANNTNQFALDTTRRDDARKQAQIAAAPAAANLIGQIKTLSGTGRPEDIEQARKLAIDNSQVFIDAGWNADQIPQIIDSVRSGGKTAWGYNQDVYENQKLLEQQGISQAAQKLAFEQINSGLTPDAGIQNIQNNRDVQDPRIKAQAVKLIQMSADDNVFSKPDPIDARIASAGIVPGSVAGSSPVGSSGRPGLVDTYEGAGNYDTLYGHSQDKGPLAGVRVSQQTIGNLKSFASSNGAYGRQQIQKLGYLATPMGKYQIVGDTLATAAKELGLPDDTVFTPAVQDQIADHLARGRLSGPRTMQGKIENIRKEWEGFKKVPDAELARAITAFENGDRTLLFGSGGSSSVGGAMARTVDTSAPAFPQQTEISMPSITRRNGPSPASQLAAAVTPSSSDAPVAQDTETFSNGKQYIGSARADSPLGRAIAERQAASAPAEDPSTVPGGYPSIMYGSTVQDTATPAAQLAEAATPVTSSNNGTASEPKKESKASAVDQVQTALDTSAVDRVFNGNQALIRQLVSPQYDGLEPAQIADKMIKEDGLVPGGNKQATLAALTETMKLVPSGLSPSMAAALVAKNAYSSDLTDSTIDLLPWADSWFDGDRFSTKGEDLTSATRYDMEGIKSDLAALGLNSKGTIDPSKGVSQIQNQRSSAVAQQQLEQFKQDLATVSRTILELQAAIRSGRDTPQIQEALRQNLIRADQLQTIINRIGETPGPTTLFMNAANSVPAR